MIEWEFIDKIGDPATIEGKLSGTKFATIYALNTGGWDCIWHQSSPPGSDFFPPKPEEPFTDIAEAARYVQTKLEEGIALWKEKAEAQARSLQRNLDQRAEAQRFVLNQYVMGRTEGDPK